MSSQNKRTDLRYKPRGSSKYFRFPLYVLLFAPVLSVAMLAQTDNDRAQISKLMSTLCDHSANPEMLLDPQSENKHRSLTYFDDQSYQLSLVPLGTVEFEQNGQASVPVRVHFRNSTREVDTRSTAEFVLRGGVWYFANFDFLGFPVIIVVVIILTVIVGISYAMGVLILRRRIVERGGLQGADVIKVFVPLFWPALVRRLKR